jgi:hypothetical protein
MFLFFVSGKMKLCPVLAKEYNIITIANMNSLQLSTYSRLPGTRVKISCLSNTFKVMGPTWLTCLRNGSWDKPIPKCLNRKEFQTELSRSSSTVNPNKATMNGEAYFLKISIGIGSRLQC